MERKLTAILSADVKGYSRLMGDDETATVKTLTAYQEILTTVIHSHHGRVVDSPGDNMLAEFASVVDAVQGAVAMQKELTIRNAQLPEHRQMLFRIGINVGDVLTEDGRLYGDGVNIAARLEGLAEAGGICISEAAYSQVKNKLALGYGYIGEQEVKNIAEPVRVYKVELDSETAAPGVTIGVAPRGRPDTKISRARPTWTTVVAVIAVLLMGAGVIVFKNLSLRSSPGQPQGVAPTTPQVEKVEIPSKEAPALALPDKPSIAVLPFTNMSGDPEQEYFSDGMTETLITDLSKVSGLFVIARTSVFTYKGKTVLPAQLSRELGVRYLVEGSVQKAGERVRINTQLIDATTGGHMWAERYDGELKDIFALQDEITQEIIRALRVEVQEAERERVRRIPTANLTAYDSWLRGVEHLWRTTPEDNTQARQMFKRAIELDPQYADAYAWLSWTYSLEWNWWNQDPQLLERMSELAQQALVLDDSLPLAHSLLGYVHLWRDKQYEQAIAEGERALALDPNYALAHVWLAEILNFAGRAEEALGLAQRAMRLNPRYPAMYPFELGTAYYFIGQYDEAIAAYKEALRRNPNFLAAYTWLALSYLERWTGQWSEDPQTLEQAVETAQQLVALSDSMFYTHGTLSWVYLWQKRYEEARAEAERALALNPNDALSPTFLGHVLNFAGRPEETPERMEQVTCSNALAVPTFCFQVLGDAYYLTRHYEEAVAAFQQALTHPPLMNLGLSAHLGLAASYSELGREEGARAEVAEILKINPNFSLEVWKQRVPYKDPAVIEGIAAALGKAGLE